MGNRVSAATDSGAVPAPPQPSVFAPATPHFPGEPPPSPTPPAPTKDEFAYNPGTMDQLHKQVKEVFPEPFEGAKFVMNKGLSQNFQVSHTVTMSNVEESGYKFSATYVGKNKFGESDMSPILMGELYPSGQMSGQAIFMPAANCRLKLVQQIQKGIAVASQFSGEWRGKTSNVNVTLANIDLVANKGMCVVDVMRSIGSRHTLGSMLLVQRAPQIPGGMMAMFHLGGRYVGKNWEISGVTIPMQMQLSAYFKRKVSENLQIAAEFETDYRQQSSQASLGYQYDLEPAHVTFKAQVDTNWCVTGVLEKKFLPYPFTFSLCGMANHAKSLYRFGVGLMVG